METCESIPGPIEGTVEGPTCPRSLCVRGLKTSTQKSTLQEYFEKYGDIEEIFLPFDEPSVNRGFAFVNYADPVNAEKVLAANGDGSHKVDGAHVKVAWSKRGRETELPTRLCVYPLASDTSEDSIRAYFSQFTRVKEVGMVYDENGRFRRFAYIEFEDGREAAEVRIRLRDQFRMEIYNHIKEEGFAIRRKKRRIEDSYPKRVKISNLDRCTTEGQIREYFTKFGEVTEVFVVRHKDTGNSMRCAYVEFQTHSQAHHVVFNFEHKIDGRRTYASYADPKGRGRWGNDGSSRCQPRSDRNNNKSPKSEPEATCSLFSQSDGTEESVTTLSGSAEICESLNLSDTHPFWEAGAPEDLAQLNISFRDTSDPGEP
ncbi:hypothetical protein L596_023572 [Steinernema carpocapsae]|uniref:RRM domain-containing protein n=1 Tax=Steinernema carpocapsae TaxID=34508 RepID=A0A4U5ME22_STECR|nr:hypothetical protein L596_023572 [Steinernema carpocapsae]